MRPEHKEYLSQRERARLLVWRERARRCTRPLTVTLAVVIGGATALIALGICIKKIIGY